MYQLKSDGVVVRLADGAFIPSDEGNADYQGYQRWLADGGIHEQDAPPSPEAVYIAWKVQRERDVSLIRVAVDGLVFDGDEGSQNRMARAVTAADSLQETTEWTLADNRVVVVTVQQLKQALRLSTEASTAIWNADRPAPPGEITSHP